MGDWGQTDGQERPDLPEIISLNLPFALQERDEGGRVYFIEVMQRNTHIRNTYGWHSKQSNCVQAVCYL